MPTNESCDKPIAPAGNVDRRMMLSTTSAALLGGSLLHAESAEAAPPPARWERILALFSLAGKVALIANNDRGACREIANILSDAGASIVIADSNIEESLAIAADIVSRGGRARALHADCNEEDDILSVFKSIGEIDKKLDILVNTEGLTSRQMLTDTTALRWDELTRTNLRAPFIFTRESVKMMMQSGKGGSIVNITTLGSVHPVIHGNAAYTSARAGVTMLTKSVALDYGKHGIRANVLMPGAIMNKVSELPSMIESNGPIHAPDRIPLGWGNLQDIASATLFLASPASAYITGQSLILDGGFLVS